MSYRIGVDLDGVCYQWTKTARYMLREILPNSPYTKDGPLGTECTRWDYIKDNVAPAHDKWLWNEGVKLGLFRHGHLFPGTIKALRALDRLGDLVAVTQRPESAVADTFAWIAFHQLPFREVHVLHGQPKTGIQVCDVFIDDKPQNCMEIKQAWPECLVMIPDRPWNQHFPEREHGVYRTYSWDNFVTCVRNHKHAADRLEGSQGHADLQRGPPVLPFGLGRDFPRL